jgi:hypothetical protein
MARFGRAEHAHGLEAICAEHGGVVPTERYTAAGDDARLVEIALLQQRARALAAEVERGAALERRLQEALAGQERLLARPRRRTGRRASSSRR